MKLLLLYLSIASVDAFGFVENISHGYPNCMSCHVSPSGGGVLTDYGRSLSKELMSSWGWKKSEDPLFGAIKQSENLKIGGDIRAIQTHFENNQVRQGRFFLMQQNLELAYRIGKTWLVSTFGTQEGPSTQPDKGEFLSERHFALHELSESIFIRAGKFRIPFGLYDPNHTRFTEGHLGFGSNSETYNLEAVQFSESGEFFLGTSLGRMDLPREQTSENSFYATSAWYIGEKNKLGLSYLFGESSSKRRNLLSLFGALSLSDSFVFLGEVAAESSHSSSDPTHRVDGIFTTQRLLYEVAKGFKPYLILEARQNDLRTETTRVFQPGFGIQWLPIPHVELQAEYQRVMMESSPGNQADSAWLLTHFYF